MKTILAYSTAVAILLAASALLFGLTTELARQGPLQGWGWPTGVAELAGSRDRVSGYWSSFGHASLYYAGDANAFKLFLDRYATLEGFPLRLVLHPAPGQKGRRHVTQPSAHYDWVLTIETGTTIEMEKAKGKPAVPRATLHLYLGDSIGVEDLQVPLNVEVHSGGEIETFVAEHVARQSLTTTGAPPPKSGDAKPPTTPPAK
jgi:hypothetical protein